MARRSNKDEQEITPEGIRRAMELDKDKIEAALANAVSNANGTPIPQRNAPTGKKPEPVEEKPTPKKEQGQFPESGKDIGFAAACANMTVDAAMCRAESAKHEDSTIAEYIKSINRKIYDETQTGGFSANIRFRVAPNDWVNVNHIMDWYRSRGFQVVNYETTHPQVGPGAGTIEHNFTILWSV